MFSMGRKCRLICESKSGISGPTCLIDLFPDIGPVFMLAELPGGTVSLLETFPMAPVYRAFNSCGCLAETRRREMELPDFVPAEMNDAGISHP